MNKKEFETPQIWRRNQIERVLKHKGHMEKQEGGGQQTVYVSGIEEA